MKMEMTKEARTVSRSITRKYNENGKKWIDLKLNIVRAFRAVQLIKNKGQVCNTVA